MSHDEQRALQQLSLEQQVVSSKIELTQQRMELTQAFIRDQRTGLATLEELEKHKENEEILVHIGGGILLKARIVDPNTVIQEIGSGVRVELSVSDAKKKAEKIIERLQKQYDGLAEDLRKLSAKAADLDSQLREAVKKIQTPAGK